MSKSQIAVRIPPPLLEKLNDYVERTGTSNTEVVVAALAQYLGATEEFLAGEVISENSQTIDEIKLLSEKGVDYTQLRSLLAAGKWKEADEETATVILKAAGIEGKDNLDLEDINKIPCVDLCTIDQLWEKYSSGQFGFSVQKRMWEEVGGKVDYETEKKLGERVGWRKGGSWLHYSDITFSTQAPMGHLPTICLVGYWSCWFFMGVFFSRAAQACNL